MKPVFISLSQLRAQEAQKTQRRRREEELGGVSGVLLWKEAFFFLLNIHRDSAESLQTPAERNFHVCSAEKFSSVSRKVSWKLSLCWKRVETQNMFDSVMQRNHKLWLHQVCRKKRKILTSCLFVSWSEFNLMSNK